MAKASDRFGCRRPAKLLLWALLAGLAAPASAAQAEAEPVQFGLAYTSDFLANLDGGLKRGTALLGKLDATAEMDLSAALMEGATAFINLQFVHGRAFSEELVGDAQVTSNIEAASALRALEAWVELPVNGEDLRLKAGLIDLNSEFDVQSVGALFLNSSHGIGPDFSQTGLNGPSIFPTTSGAVMLSARSGGWTGRVGLFDAVAGDPNRPGRTRIGYPGAKGLLSVVEVERSLGDSAAVKGGVWSYSTRFDALAEFDPSGKPRRLEGNKGAYATLEGRIAGPDERALDGWVRIGVANARINPIGTSIGGGLSWGNDERALGLAFAHARLGGPAKEVGLLNEDALDEAETNIELTYRMVVREGVTVQPDVQYVINPGWRPDLDDALVAGVRFVFELP